MFRHFLLLFFGFLGSLNHGVAANSQKQYILSFSREKGFDSELYNVTLPRNIIVPSAPITIRQQQTNNQITQNNVSYNLLLQENSPVFRLVDERIMVVGRLDYETSRNYLMNLSVIFAMNRVPAGKRTTRISITIVDVNDNRPLQDTSDGVQYLHMQAPIGTEVLKIKASVPDSSVQFDEITYTLLNHQDVFRIDSGTGKVTTSKLLNGTYQKNYDLQVMTQVKSARSDAGNDNRSKSDTKVYHIMITDTILDRSQCPKPLNLYILENEEVGSCPFVLREYDSVDNVKENRGLIYLSEYNSSSPMDLPRKEILYNLGDFLTYYKWTSEICIRKDINYREFERYEFITYHSDDKSDRCGEMNIFINVESSPVLMKPNANIFISENQPPGIFVMNVNATDADESKSKMPIEFSLTQDEDGKCFNINSSTGVVTTSMSFDRETKDSYKIKVVANKPTRSGRFNNDTEVYEIRISDENDNVPRFAKSQYDFSVAKKELIGKCIGRVEATDADLSSKLEYNIESGNDAKKFWINKNVGDICITAYLQHNETYNFTVRVFDGRHESRTHVKIDVEKVEVIATKPTGANETPVSDKKDNRQKFTKLQNHFWVPENVPTGECPAKVEMVDNYHMTGSIDYSISSGNDDKTLKMNQITGEICVAERLNYTKTRNYNLTVQAFDGLNKAHFHVIIEVESAPVLDRISRQIEVRHDTRPGSWVMRVHATDPDISETKKPITYSFNGRNSFLRFSINSSSGDVTVARPLQFGVSYALRVNATKSGHDGGFISTAATFNIEIPDANDSFPEFEQLEYNAVISKNEEVGYCPINFRTKYSHRNISYISTIGEVQNRVCIGNPLDNMEGRSKEFIVYAFDGFYVTSAHVRIDVEKSPEIKKNNGDIFIYKKQKPGSFVVQVNATNTNIFGTKKPIEFGLIQSGDSEYFAIDPRTGVVTTSKLFDRETKLSYKFEIFVNQPTRDGHPNVQIQWYEILISDEIPTIVDDDASGTSLMKYIIFGIIAFLLVAISITVFIFREEIFN